MYCSFIGAWSNALSREWGRLRDERRLRFERNRFELLKGAMKTL